MIADIGQPRQNTIRGSTNQTLSGLWKGNLDPHCVLCKVLHDIGFYCAPRSLAGIKSSIAMMNSFWNSLKLPALSRENLERIILCGVFVFRGSVRPSCILFERFS